MIFKNYEKYIKEVDNQFINLSKSSIFKSLTIEQFSIKITSKKKFYLMIRFLFCIKISSLGKNM